MEVAISSKKNGETRKMYHLLAHSNLRVRGLALFENIHPNYDYFHFIAKNNKRIEKIKNYLEQFGFTCTDKLSEKEHTYVLGIKCP